MPRIESLLIANRGEIARRIRRTASAMGIRTIAVYSDGDALAQHVAEADAAFALGGRTAAETYLNKDKLLDAARRAGAAAIHPGYGFLSEDAGFARAVEAAGLVWIGPPPAAIEAMGDKLAAKRMMVEAGVPTLPSIEVSSGEVGSDAAQAIGFPILVKAAAGGGGKGMRVVTGPAELNAAVAAAAREAGAAFGDPTVFLERYVPVARHIEVQVIGDRHGKLLHCFERECSIQRRHQKIVEEAPSPHVHPALRERLTDAALKAARAVNYSSVGTVEFLVAGEEFWFLEMNTRLQVEHPVTEEVCGLDLVREQIAIACGQPLAIEQADLSLNGHAIEVRVYAEDPAAGFLPATGTLAEWSPATEPHLRFESGVQSGAVVGLEFDPMLAKVVAHAATRDEAAARLALGLERTRLHGLPNNKDFLVALLRNPAFLSGDTTTDFLTRVDIVSGCAASDDAKRKAAILAAMAGHCARRGKGPLAALPPAWRNTPMPPQTASFRIGEQVWRVDYRARRDGRFAIECADHQSVVRVLDFSADAIALEMDGDRLAAGVARSGTAWMFDVSGRTLLADELPRFARAAGEASNGALTAPMPGVVVAIHVAEGAQVNVGDDLLVLEAMKMEHRIRAPADGLVGELKVKVGSQVSRGQLLVTVGQPEADRP